MKTDSLVECLYTCSVCGQAGFTLRGLRAHCCRSKPGRARLTNADIGRSLSPSAPNETAGRLPQDARNPNARGEQVEAAGEVLCGAMAALANRPATARRMTGASSSARPGYSGAALRAPGTCGSEQTIPVRLSCRPTSHGVRPPLRCPRRQSQPGPGRAGQVVFNE